MSFLSGIVNFGKTALGFLGGNSIASTLARTAILGYAVNKLSQSALKANELGSETNNIDKGVRLQVKPDAEAKIPVLYGSAYFGGNISDAAMTNANKTMWYCLVLSEKTGSKYSNSAATGYTFEDVYWNQQRIVFQADGVTADYTVDRSGTIDRSVSGLVKVYLYAGSSSDGQVPAGYTGSVPNADTLFPNWAPSTHPMDDLVFALVRVDYSREKNVTGIGNMLFHVESDMRNPGDVLYDYLISDVYGAGISASELKTADFTTLNTYSQTSVNYTDQGTGSATLANRYQINGLLDTKNDVLKNAEKITSAAGSYLSYDTHEGQWGVVINKAEASLASFDDNNILGNIAVGGTGLQDLYNGVKVAFPHRDLRDSADFVKIEVPSGDRNANEPNNTLNISYDIINEPVQAEVLGFIELKQSRVDLIIQFETDFSYINLKAGDVIDISNERYGFSSKLFRIITITERQDTDGALSMSITALEYDSDVYSTQNITRYTRSDDDGIITIGSIGIPGTPQVTKFERSNRPRIEIETTAPTGVVEGIEFWITFDYQETDDALRSYTLIGTKRPVGGGVYTSGTDVTFEYTNLNAENFYIKTRGVNTTTTGPFSTPSGLVEFVPEQVPDAITPDTSILDEGGGLATALGIVSLLNNLDGLFGGDSNTSLFDKIFQTFEDVTGFDIVGETTDGSFVVPTNISIQDEGTEISSSVSVINFTGASVEASADGTVITVSHTGDDGGDGGEVTPPVDPNDPTTPGSGGSAGSALTILQTWPDSRNDDGYPLEFVPPNFVPINGSFYIRWGLTSGSIYGPLGGGAGSIHLYKSDGTLVQSIAGSSCIVHNDVLEIPFSPRQLKTDYFILIDEDFVSYCNATSNNPITSPGTWYFSTPTTTTTPYTLPESNTNISILTLGQCADEIQIITNNSYLTIGSGALTFNPGGITAPIGSFTVSPDGYIATASVSGIGLAIGTNYTVTAPEGLLLGGDECNSSAPSNAFTGSFIRNAPFNHISYDVDSDEWEGNVNQLNLAHPRSNIYITFNDLSARFGTGFIHLYEQSGALHQSFDVEGTYVNLLLNIAGGILTINPTVGMDKSKSYYILADAGSIVNNCGEQWVVSNSSEITLTVDPGAIIQSGEVAPSGSINEDGITLNTDRNVTPGSGNILIYDNNNNLVASIPATHPAITYGA